MNIVSDLGTDLAFAFLVEKRHQQEIDSVEAVALIDRVRKLLEELSEIRSIKASASSHGSTADQTAGH